MGGAKLVRLQIGASFLDAIGATSAFEGLERLEVVNAYQYDRENFFSLQVLRFKGGKPSREALSEFLRERFHAHFFQVVEESGPEVTCLLKQDLTTGFFRLLEPGPWAIVFPMTVDPRHVMVNLLAHEDVLPELLALLDQFTRDYKVVGQQDLDPHASTGDAWAGFTFPWPTFTRRQKEVVGYAASRGFFESPKRVSARQLAGHFGISESSFNELVRKVVNRAVTFFFGDGKGKR
ncbi:MAG: helix-turn-helix domain-containing protein [Promethearchaeota archaeon]